MTTTTAAPKTTAVATVRPTAAPWLAALVALLLLAGAGAWRVPALVTALSDVGGAAATQVDTSHGLVVLAGYELLSGPTPEELGGVTHGIGGYVDSEHELARVHLTLGGADQRVDPGSFRLRLPNGTDVSPDTSTIPPGALPGGSDVDASLSFVVPSARGAYSLVVHDGDVVTVLPLGDAGAAPRPAVHQH